MGGVGVLRKIRRNALRFVRNVHPQLGLRESDIILASFPKSGNTWMRFIWANMIAELEFGGRVVGFHSLDGEMICDHDKYNYGGLEYESLPRLIKTHQRFDERVFRGNRVLYVHRHPCDVMISYHAFRAAKLRRSRVSRMSFSEFLRSEKYGVSAWRRHMESWLPRATVIVSYEKLREDGCREVERVLRDLKIRNVDRDTVEKAVERASFANTRMLEEAFGRPGAEKFTPNFKFTRSGTSGDWNSCFDQEDMLYLRSEVDLRGLSDMLSA
jgi:hypothetical protein